MPEGRPAGFPTRWQWMGAGPRDGLLIHCALAHSGAWAGMMARLEAELTALAFDTPGHGRSGDWDRVEDYHALATRVAAALIEGEVGAPADLIGHSFGATVALRLALERPELVQSLVLIEPVLFAAAAGTAAHAAHERASESSMAALTDGDRETATRLFTDMWGAGRPWAELSAAQRRYMSERIHLIEATEPAVSHDNAGLLGAGRLEAVEVPALLMEGGDSPPVIGAILTAILERLPAAERATIPGAGHMAPITHPDAVAARIAGFLE